LVDQRRKDGPAGSLGLTTLLLIGLLTRVAGGALTAPLGVGGLLAELTRSAVRF